MKYDCRISISSARRSLNLFLSNGQTEESNLWTIEQASLSLVASTNMTYNLDNDVS